MEELELAGLEEKKLSGYTEWNPILEGLPWRSGLVGLQWAEPGPRWELQRQVSPQSRPSRQHCPDVGGDGAFLSLGVSGMGSVATWEEGTAMFKLGRDDHQGSSLLRALAFWDRWDRLSSLRFWRKDGFADLSLMCAL